MKILMFAAAGLLAAQPSLVLEPAVITACENGTGRATVLWNSAGVSPVTVYAGDAAMTGGESAAGSASTGPWVTDGLLFTLRRADGQIIASVRAVLQCESGSYWPLEAGNEWHFRVNDRAVTGAHAVWRVAAKEDVAGVTWSVLDPGPYGRTRLRNDADGRIHRLTEDGRDVVLLDPAGTDAVWAVTGRTPNARTLAGNFGEELSWRGPVVGLSQESGRVARGVGPTYYQTNVIAGSSGGFGSSYTLLEAVVGGVRFVPNYPRVELTLETQEANLSARGARNCAIPCYFVACFGADLPTAYRPCLEASLRGGKGRVALLDPAGVPVFETAAEGWVRIPLYRAPATLLPAGKYSVQANVNGTTLTLPLEIQ